jgi:Spy/CpxP family protein refolding chaperone
MRKRDTLFIAALLLGLTSIAAAASPGNAPPLPMAGARIVNVATEAQLQTAMANLQNGANGAGQPRQFYWVRLSP